MMRAVAVDEAKELTVRRLVDLIVGGGHFFPEDYSDAELVDDFASEVDGGFAAKTSTTALMLGGYVAAALVLAPYGLIEAAPVGRSLADSILEAAPEPAPWMQKPRVASDLGISPRPLSEEHRLALIEGSRRSVQDVTDRLGSLDALDLAASIEGDLIEARADHATYAAFAYGLGIYLRLFEARRVGSSD